MTNLNAHALFNRLKSPPSYLINLTPSEKHTVPLRDARRAIRNQLRQAFRQPLAFVEHGQLLAPGAWRYFPGDPPTFAPRFLTQGSWAYGTLNLPAQPGQEMDLDDGVYLPAPFVPALDGLRPAIDSSAYFTIVEKALEPLCRSKGWEIVRKDTCVRIRLPIRAAHIDLPLYAVPDADFQELERAYVDMAGHSFGTRAPINDTLRLNRGKVRLDSSTVMLAHRTEGWTPSDPRRLHDWFNDAIEEYGTALRRTCRYLKGWRDQRWENGALSSIAIMTCTVNALEEIEGTLPSDRDDLMALRVAERLPRLLEKPVQNPVLNGQLLNGAWTAHEKAAILSETKRMADLFGQALEDSSLFHDAVKLLRTAFGPRLPDAPHAMETCGNDEVRPFRPAPAAILTGHSTSG